VILEPSICFSEEIRYNEDVCHSEKAHGIEKLKNLEDERILTDPSFQFLNELRSYRDLSNHEFKSTIYREFGEF
jgi:hypothetical protein